MQKKTENIKRRKLRNRFKVKKASVGVPRLSVFRSARHNFCQIIDDAVGKTLVQASTLEQHLRKKTGGNIEAAQIVGKLLAQRAKDLGIKKVVFDRGSYLLHGRVKALATSARAEGLIF